MDEQKYKIVGFLFLDRRPPAFVLPIFSVSAFPERGLFVQVIDPATSLITSFKPLKSSGSLDGLAKKIYEVSVGSGQQYGIVVSTEQEFFGDYCSCVDFFLELSNDNEFSDAFGIQVFSFLENNEAKQASRLSFSKALKKNNESQKSQNFLESSVLMTGWEMVEETLSDKGNINQLKSIFEYNFIIDDTNAISAIVPDGEGFLSKDEMSIILADLQDEFGPILTNDNFRIDNRKIVDEKPEAFEDEEYIYNRFKGFMGQLGRQEERIAFLIACILGMPHYANVFLKKSDRAQSGRMASKLLLQGLTKKNVNTENFYDQLSFVIYKIRQEWATGERDLLFLFMQKWISEDEGEMLKLRDMKQAYYYPYFDLKKNSRMAIFLSTKQIKVQDLFDKDFAGSLHKFVRYNREFDNLYFRGT